MTPTLHDPRRQRGLDHDRQRCRRYLNINRMALGEPAYEWLIDKMDETNHSLLQLLSVIIMEQGEQHRSPPYWEGMLREQEYRITSNLFTVIDT